MQPVIQRNLQIMSDAVLNFAKQVSEGIEVIKNCRHADIVGILDDEITYVIKSTCPFERLREQLKKGVHNVSQTR